MIYPTDEDFRLFVEVLQSENFSISKYLPAISEDWFSHMVNCIGYIERTAKYLNNDFHHECARVLYKIVKNHSDLVDSNKRSSVMGVIIFCLVNDYYVIDPQQLKDQAKRIAKTKGRDNEDVVCERVAECLREFIVHI